MSKRTSVIASDSQILTAQQVADRLQCHIETVRRAIKRGDLKAFFIPGSAGYRITAEQLVDFENRLLQREA